MGLSLKKGQALSLVKQDGASLTQIRLGLGWDAVQRTRGFFGQSKVTAIDIDLDASAILFDTNAQPLEIVFYNQLSSKDGSVRHTGDNLTGEGDGDDESIRVNLPGVSAAVQHIVFVITSYSQQSFDSVENAFCRVIDDSVSGSPEVANYQLTETGPYTAMVMAKLTRSGSKWSFQALGVPAHGKTPLDVVHAAAAAL